MYKIGDLILYGNTGICRITDISTRNIPGRDKNQLYYVLEPFYQDRTTIYTPTDTKVFMRPVVSREEAEKLIALIPTIKAKPYHNRATSELEQHYRAFFKSHNCEDLIEITMSIYNKRQELAEQKRKFGSVDERFMKQAEDLLFGELSVALDVPKDEMPAYIERRIGEIAEGDVE
ncbi:MAG: CarD family transcriptional regulator [Oscillospiraceae bacterium]|jgi:CarD family transcriptional regulator|nr:CarD family transcriptional regulator [Oscillospiraceae bacterium]